jgi:hypothetical protein
LDTHYSCFDFTNHGECALKDNLCPIDADSVQDAVDSMRASMTDPLPDFDLRIGYFDHNDLGDAKGASRDFVKIQYRHQDTASENSTKPKPSGSAQILDCQFDRQTYKVLHRQSWICRHKDPRHLWEEGRFEKLQEDYAKAFPEMVNETAECSTNSAFR